MGQAIISRTAASASDPPDGRVLPEHQGRGIGSQMVTALLERLRSCYTIDLAYDDDVVPFYERLGGTRLNAVAWRNHDRLGAADG